MAVRWLGQDGAERSLTFADLSQASSRFANVLGSLGVARGDVVFLLLPRVPEVYVCALGALKAGAVVSPLFSAFGPEPIATRVNIGRGKALVTTAALYRRKVAPVRDAMPTLQHVLLAGAAGSAAAPDPPPDGTLDLDRLMAQASAQFAVVQTRPEDLALLHFTSGTTGKPQGRDARARGRGRRTTRPGRYALDLHADDIFWCTADPGWVTGTSYGSHRAAAARRDDDRRRGRVRRRALVPRAAASAKSASGTPRRPRSGC